MKVLYHRVYKDYLVKILYSHSINCAKELQESSSINKTTSLISQNAMKTVKKLIILEKSSIWQAATVGSRKWCWRGN